jgi:hypothetical protein
MLFILLYILPLSTLSTLYALSDLYAFNALNTSLTSFARINSLEVVLNVLNWCLGFYRPWLFLLQGSGFNALSALPTFF